MLGCVDDPEDQRALRLVCKRCRASVDSRVVAVGDYPEVDSEEDEPAVEQ